MSTNLDTLLAITPQKDILPSNHKQSTTRRDVRDVELFAQFLSWVWIKLMALLMFWIYLKMKAQQNTIPWSVVIQKQLPQSKSFESKFSSLRITRFRDPWLWPSLVWSCMCWGIARCGFSAQIDEGSALFQDTNSVESIPSYWSKLPSPQIPSPTSHLPNGLSRFTE